MINVLYVDKSKEFAGELLNFLNTNDYKVIYTDTIDNISENILSNEINLVLCDLNVAKKENTNFIQGIAELDVPVIILSETENTEYEIESLNQGAADFIVKSSNFETINARLRNIYKNTMNRILSLDVHGKKCLLNVITRVITNNEDIYITLNQKEFLIIYHLITNKNKIIGYEQLRKVLAEHNDVEITEKYINVIIFRIRTKLKLYNLNSIRGKGYIWMDDL